ncbi:hypothetical protein [Tateyamaria pelophila]|uniref:hypothetical protein n=1 Tax=Tateyamaria pelophila TaxID=328415 RepID=UPI001CBF80AE|nr:hypothetical protein [Tateyamaria pelophila]
MMRWAAGLLSILPMPALALSCVPYGVTDAYLEAEASADAYVPVLGTLEFDASAVPQVDWDKQGDVPALTEIPAVLKGDALTPRGTTRPLETSVTFEVKCSGPWCPSPKPGRVLAFLRETGEAGFGVSIGACGGFLFGNPKPEQVNAVKDCLTGRACPPSARR